MSMRLKFGGNEIYLPDSGSRILFIKQTVYRG